ncbi:MAG: sigma-70 family RNA polymerase sigma factor [Planctomycetaceae bacterium]
MLNACLSVPMDLSHEPLPDSPPPMTETTVCCDGRQRELGARVTERSDEELMRQFQNGSHEAFAELHRRYEPQVLKYAIWWVHDVVAADDIAQEAFLSLVKAAVDFDASRPFRPWFLRVLRLRCLQFTDAERRRERKRRRLAQLIPSPDRNPTVNQLMVDERRFHVCNSVRNALRFIPEQRRRLVVQHLAEGLTFREIGEREGFSRQRCHQLISRVVLHLKDQLAEFSDSRFTLPSPTAHSVKGGV